MKRSLVKRLLVVCLGFCVTQTVLAVDQIPNTAAPGSGAEQEDQAQLARRLNSVEILIEKSSAAKQIVSSANPDALSRRKKASGLRLQAVQAYQAGDSAKASRLLNEAAKTMFEGVRLAARNQVDPLKKQRDFDARLESVKALLTAQKRISKEKKKGEQAVELSNRIEAQIQEATALVAANKLDQGRVVLDKAYVMAKTAIEKLRNGDTLVRSLHFASKEEEYRYELDRNDTHRMLIKILLKKKLASNPTLAGTVQKYIEQSDRLRAMAEEQAAKGDYESGIKRLDESTHELVRAIRRGGIYIPG